MDITWIKQPTNTSCGQTSIAMALGVSVDEVIKVVGHATITYVHDRARAVLKLGGTLGVTENCKSKSELPEMALVRIACRRRDRRSPDGYGKATRKTGHCVLWANGKFYDPTFGVSEEIQVPGGVLESYMEIGRPAPKVRFTDVRTAAYNALPAELTCPCCQATKSKAEFGVRVVKKDEAGNPLKAVRQSRCRSCR